jgi:PHP family Zn ribbon phosphoesterase
VRKKTKCTLDTPRFDERGGRLIIGVCDACCPDWDYQLKKYKDRQGLSLNNKSAKTLEWYCSMCDMTLVSSMESDLLDYMKT